MTTENLTDSLIILFEENGFVFVEMKYETLAYKVIDVKNGIRTLLFARIYTKNLIIVRFMLVRETNKIAKKYTIEQIAGDINRISQNNMFFHIEYGKFDYMEVMKKILENTDRIKDYLLDIVKNPNSTMNFEYRKFICDEFNKENGSFIFYKNSYAKKREEFFCTSKGFYAI